MTYVALLFILCDVCVTYVALLFILFRLEASSNLIDETLVLANESHNEAEQAYQTSLRTLTQVESLRTSIVNTSLLQQQANIVKEQVCRPI